MNDKKLINKWYMISRIIITILTFLIFSIMLINEDSSFSIVPIIFSIIVFCISFPSTMLSKKMIDIGNKIDNKTLKIMYYVIVLPILIFIIFIAIYLIINNIIDTIPNPNEIGASLGQALLTLFVIAVVTTYIVVPYIQTIIVLILANFIKK